MNRTLERILRRGALPALPLLLGSALASAQAKIFVEDAGTFTGASVGGAGDVNADGYDDVIFGAPNYAGSTGGRAFVLSGRTGELLHTVIGAARENDDFGVAVSGAGDVNADGRDDFIVGMNDFFGASATARVFSGVDGSLLYAFTGLQGSNFGYTVGGAGDVDADGYDDLIAGCGPFGLNGYTLVLSGRTGEVLHRLDVGATRAVDGAGDVNGDGREDVLIAAQAHLQGELHGIVRVVSGLDGALLFRFAEPFASGFGWSASGGGDADGDGIPDFLVGADHGGKVFSGAHGGALQSFDGRHVDFAGDVDGDGRDDFIVGADADLGLDVRVISGWSGAVLFTVAGADVQAVGGAGDVNQDGFGDVIVGKPLPGPDVAWVVLGNCPEPAAYCSGAPNSVGSGATIDHTGGPAIVAANFELQVTGAVPESSGLFYYGTETARTPFGDGVACVGGSTFRLNPPGTTDAAGTMSRLLDWSQSPEGFGPGQIVPGSTWYFQFWYRDPGSSGTGFNLSDALSATFCP